jgi:hypothetical protein
MKIVMPKWLEFNSDKLEGKILALSNKRRHWPNHQRTSHRWVVFKIVVYKER